MWPSQVSVQGPSTEHRGNLIPLTKNTEGIRVQEKGRKAKSSMKKDKDNWPRGPKVSSCLHLG